MSPQSASAKIIKPIIPPIVTPTMAPVLRWLELEFPEVPDVPEFDELVSGLLVWEGEEKKFEVEWVPADEVLLDVDYSS
jgi:hypothetical protein